MPERGRSPGAKGTAFPHAQRPQKSARPGSAGGKPFNAPAGKRELPPDRREPLPARSMAHLQKKSGNAALAAGQAKPLAKSLANASPKTAPVPPDTLVRVSKLLAERGLCSRREADAYIERGLVLVNGERVTELGTRARADATVTLAGEATAQQSRQATVLLHKPMGYVSGQPEPGYQPAVVLILPENQFRGADDPAFEPRILKGLAPAGRLDIDSTGLLVLTQDGRIARQLIGEDSTVEKEYLVRVEGQLVSNGLALLNHGLALDGKPLRPARVEWLNEDQLRFILREGKKRQIRRMCELVGLRVVGLKRVRMGKVKLGDLPPGKWRYLRAGERF